MKLSKCCLVATECGDKGYCRLAEIEMSTPGGKKLGIPGPIGARYPSLYVFYAVPAETVRRVFARVVECTAKRRKPPATGRL
jgi:hypothetical protein